LGLFVSQHCAGLIACVIGVTGCKGQIKQAVPIALQGTIRTALTITPEGRHNGKVFNNNTNGIRARKKNRGFAQMTKLFIGLSLILVFCSLVYAESENYCHDEKSWKEWDALIEKNPNDMEVQALHALRIGLCAKVDRGQITLDKATEIFESAREAIIQKRKEDQKREKDGQKL
jgi:hypothetical protein